MGPFFAVIGASAAGGASSGNSQLALWLVAFLAVMVAVHWAVLWLLGHAVLRLPVPALLLGSNANIGGPATAAGAHS